MQTSRATLGATMIIVVLFTLLLLTIILASTVQMGLSSRRSTADQTATLAAQYNAESEMNLAKAQLRDLQTLLSSRKVGESLPPSAGVALPMSEKDKTNIDLPLGEGMREIERVAAAFCGYDASLFAQGNENRNVLKAPRPELTDTIVINGKKVEKFTDPLECTVTGESWTRFAPLALARFVNPAAYALLPAAERPPATLLSTTTLNEREAALAEWWRKKFEPQKVGENVTYQLRPTRVIKADQDTYRFYFGIEKFTVKSGDGKAAKRVLSGERSDRGEWWFQVNRPNLLAYMVLIDEQGTGAATDVNIINQNFNGPMHTNGRFLFGPNASASFTGRLSSTGLDYSMSPAADPKPAVYFTTSFNAGTKRWDRSMVQADPSAKKITDDLLSKMQNGAPIMVNNIKNAMKNGELEVNFQAKKVELPRNEELLSRWEDAFRSGLIAPGSATVRSEVLNTSRVTRPQIVRLYAGDKDGLALNTYAANKWVEQPGNIFQYIEFCDVPAGPVVQQPICDANKYRVDASQRLQKYDPSRTPPWKTEKFGFNGVIFVDEVASLEGPDRINPDRSINTLSNVRPALASFSNLTVLSLKDIRIRTDLAMSQTPCPLASSSYKIPCVEGAENMLGLFSSTGNIIIDYWAPDNINLHLAAVASNGTITAQCYDNNVDGSNVNRTGYSLGCDAPSMKAINWSPRPIGSTEAPNPADQVAGKKQERGRVYLIGSLVQKTYGAVGATYMGTVHGYNREYHHDPRFARDKRPRGLPDSPSWDVLDAYSITDEKEKVALENLVWRQVNAADF